MKKAEGVTVKIVRGGYEVSIPGHAPRVYKPARGPLTQRGALECAKFAYRQACAHIKKFQADYDRRFPKTNPRQRPAGRKCGNCRHDVSMHRYMIGAPSSGPQKCGVKGCDCVVYAQKGPRYKNPNRTNPTACRGCGRCVARPRPRPGECRRVGP